MPTISTPDKQAQKKLFHNEWVNVYPTTLALESIHFWKENNRTIFTFERLCRLRKKKLEELSIEDITRFVAESDIHKLQVLTDSIARNGVQVPLVIRDDGKLLDGNRRFFACQLLKIQCAKDRKLLPNFLKEIPALVIREADLKDNLELKILAEANFIPDLKISWPLDAQARAVNEYYQRVKKDKRLDHETALAEVISVFGIQRQRAVDLMDTLTLTKQFIAEGSSEDDRVRRREIVEDKFVYLWEFRNKAMRGRGAYTDEVELKEVRDFFFQMMAKGIDNPIKNVKQVEPLVQSKRDQVAWSILKESKGSKLPMVVSIMNEKKEVRKDEDRIRVFLGWLKDTNKFTPKANLLLKEVAELAMKKSRG